MHLQLRATITKTISVRITDAFLLDWIVVLSEYKDYSCLVVRLIETEGLFTSKTSLSRSQQPSLRPGILMKSKEYIWIIRFYNKFTVRIITNSLVEDKLINTSARAEGRSNFLKLSLCEHASSPCSTKWGEESTSGDSEVNFADGKSQRSESAYESYSWSSYLGGGVCLTRRNSSLLLGFLMIAASLYVAIDGLRNWNKTRVELLGDFCTKIELGAAVLVPPYDLLYAPP